MKVWDQGSIVRVTVSTREVEDFAKRWPCFGQRTRISFVFNAHNGDLVEIAGDHNKDAGAVNALLEDARKAAARQGYFNGRS